MTKEDDFMRLKKYFVPAFMIGMVMALTGCGEAFPSLTAEEYDQTVEYAVGLLMKYSRNEQAKLTYVDVNYEKKRREAKAMELAKAEESSAHLTPGPYDNEYEDDEISADVSSSGSEDSTGASDTDEAGKDSSSSESSEESSKESSENASKDASKTADKDSNDKDGKDDKDRSGEGSKSTSSSAGETGTITLSADNTQEILNDIFLSYQGYSVSSTYPESSKSYVINADKGKKLLVLRFDLYNASDSAKDVNMLKLDLLFQIILNGKNIGYSSVTFLPNDLTSYVGTIESRAHESLAILTQIDEKNASNVDTLGLIMTKGGKDQKINLR